MLGLALFWDLLASQELHFRPLISQIVHSFQENSLSQDLQLILYYKAQDQDVSEVEQVFLKDVQRFVPVKPVGPERHY